MKTWGGAKIEVAAPPLELEEKWDIVQGIPTAQEQIPCCTKRRCKMVTVSWASNINPEDIIWYLCDECQQDEFGRWPDGVVPITHEEIGPDSKLLLLTATVPAPKRQKRKQVTQVDALVQHPQNKKCFENHFGVTFTVTPKEEKNNSNSDSGIRS